MSPESTGRNRGRRNDFASEQARTAVKKEFARRLYQMALERGWRQADVARASGLARDRVSNYFRGLAIPDAPQLAKLCKAFGDIEPSKLLPNVDEAMEAAIMQRGSTGTEREIAPRMEDNLLEFRSISGLPGRALLRVNRVVSIDTAMNVIQIVRKDDADTADGA